MKKLNNIVGKTKLWLDDNGLELSPEKSGNAQKTP